MKLSRREALKTAALTACTLGARGRTTGAAEAWPAPLDYGRSFLCNTAAFNAVRFWVESRTRILDDQTGTATDFLQCGSCKSENTFAEENLFHEDNYDFLPIWGGGQWLVFRRPVRAHEGYRKVHTAESLWGAPELKLREGRNVRELESWEALRDATAEGLPLVTQTELSNPETGLRAILECPSKTMNISLEKQLYQVDTGPVVYPDLSVRPEALIDCLHLAFVAFNAPHFADFVVEQETPAAEDGTVPVYHYTKPFSLPAKNRIFALG